MPRFAPLSLVLVATPALATEPVMPPHVVGEMFCLARTVGDMSMVVDYFSSDLYAAVGQAMLKNAELQKQHPDEKPPFGDGIPYASFPDAPSECIVDYEGAKAHPTEVAVTYKFADAPNAGWTDMLILVNAGDEWQLADVQYADGSRLTQALAAAF